MPVDPRLTEFRCSSGHAAILVLLPHAQSAKDATLYCRQCHEPMTAFDPDPTDLTDMALTLDGD